MPAEPYQEPKLTLEMERELRQGELDFALSSGRQKFTTSMAAAQIGREVDFVRELIDLGRLEAFQDSAYGERKSSIITRRSLLRYLAATANFVPSGYNSWLDVLVDELTAPQLDRVIARATARRKRMP